MDNIIAQLEREYCPPLDSALVSAILLDYDLTSKSALSQARTTLDHLRAQAVLEEHTGFDPLASGGDFAIPAAPEVDGSIVEKTQFLERPRSEESDLTSLSQLQSEPSWDPDDVESNGLDDAENEYTAGLEALDVQSKKVMLREMFPMLKPFTVENTLRKCQANFRRTVEELLNRAFFEDGAGGGLEGIGFKGVDAFAEDLRRMDGNNSGSKRARRRNERTEESVSWPTTTNGAVMASRWDAMRHDIQFIASRTHRTFNEISYVYHANGASLPATIRAILDGIDKPTVFITEEPFIRQISHDFSQEFPTISSTHIMALVRLTYPSTSAAHELARELETASDRSNRTGGIQITTQFPPIETPSSQPTTSYYTRDQSRLVSAPNAAALASFNSKKRDTAFAQASAAYRKSKSNPLMAAAASYYSDLGREHDAAARIYSAAAADALVEAQSTDNMLDLHGVSVKDAVRIAKEKVRIWWVGLEERSMGRRAGVGVGYKIITGIGRHSEGGKGKIGPAVTKMLMREKWKVEIGEGVVTITGVR